MLSKNISGSRAKPRSPALTGLAVFLTLLLFTGVGLASTTGTSNAQAQESVARADVLRATWRASDLLQAKENYQDAALIWTSNADYSNASLALLKAGDVCVVLSEFHEALKLYHQAAALTTKSGDRMAHGRALSQIGLIYSYMGDNDAAKQHVTEAMGILKVAETDPDATARSVYGQALSNMAEVLYAEGYFPKALDYFKEAGKFLANDPDGLAKMHLFAGYIAGSLGDADTALTEVTQSLNGYRAIKNKDGEGLALSALGQFHTFKENQEQSIQLHNDAINIFRFVGDQLGEAIALDGLGQAYDKLNDTRLALKNYDDSLRLFENVGALDFVAAMTFKLATFYQRTGNHEQALAYFHRCLTLSRAAKKLRNEANALSEIAIVYASQGRSNEAVKQHRKAQEFYELIGDRRGQAIALNNYGDFQLRTGQNQQALNIYRDALSLSEKVDDKSIVLTTLYNLSRAHRALGDYDVSIDFIKQAIDLSERLRANVGSMDARASFFSSLRQYYDLYRDILMDLDRVNPGKGFATRAFFISEESRARSLLDQLQASQANLREGAAAELLRREREVNGTTQSLAEYAYNLSLSNKRDSTERVEIANRLDRLRAESQQIQAQLSAQNPKQPSLAPFQLRDLGQIQRELQAAGGMLLEYSLGDERSYLWAITPDSIHSYELPPRQDLEVATREVYDLMTTRQKLDGGAYTDYRAIIEAADACYLEKAAQLSRTLLGPVARQLGTKRLIVVTEGALQYLPFEALPAPATVSTASETPPYVIQTNEVVVLPSMSTLMMMRAERRRAASPDKIVAVIADPVFGTQDERVKRRELSETTAHAASSPIDQQIPEALTRDGGPSRLAYASEEADAISEAAPWGTTMIARGFDANRETALSPQVGEYQIVHFATHGFLDSEHPELSAIVLSMVDQNGVKKSGLLTLHDIYSLDLSAELTVLSACQTALGKDIKGEGMVGLTHSFMSAGAKSVVASLWKVDDRATNVLMSDFYHSMLRNSVPPVTALRASKLKMIQDKRWNQPYYWAGFVFQGDYESRIDVESNSRLSIGLALLLLVVITSGLIVFRRRRRRSSSSIGQGMFF